VVTRVLDLLQVVVVGHASVDHYGGLVVPPRALLQRSEHALHGLAVQNVAVEYLVRLWEALLVDDQSYDHLLAVRPLVA